MFSALFFLKQKTAFEMRISDGSSDVCSSDLMALADALGIESFTLVGHDWGGAVAWLAALTHPSRVKRLVIANAPHPLVFPKTVIEDEAQRAAPHYMRAFRSPGMEKMIAAVGLDNFFVKILQLG